MRWLAAKMHVCLYFIKTHAYKICDYQSRMIIIRNNKTWYIFFANECIELNIRLARGMPCGKGSVILENNCYLP